MTTLKIDLNNIKINDSVKTDKVEIEGYIITTCKPQNGRPNGSKNLIITKDDQVSPDGAKCAPRVIAEYKNNGWLFNGKSINSMWETLQNHFEAIQKILEVMNKNP